MTSPAVFSHEVRVLLCGSCGAPLEVPPAGGSAACSYCRAVSQVRRRDESADGAGAAAPVDEAQRFERLRAHAQHPTVLPDSLKHLVAGSKIAADRVPDAMADWQRTRTEMAAGAQFPVAERLFHLTVLLSDHFARAGDSLRVRALLETALELLTAPRHRQVLRGSLAKHAARAGDLAGADAWFAGCSPVSDDIHVDTAWRASKAYVSTLRGDWPGVTHALGSRTGDVPLADGEAEGCALLRANALERSGQLPEAVEQLLKAMRQSSRGPAAFQQYLGMHEPLELCPQSFPQAHARFEEIVASREVPKVQERNVWLGPGLAMIMFGGIGLALLGVSVSELASANGKVTTALSVGSLGLVFAAFAALCVWGLQSGRKAKARDLRILESGLDATLTVVDFNRGGKNQSDSLKVSVQVPDGDAFDCTLVVTIPENQLPRVAVGSILRGKVDPGDRSMTIVLLEPV